jgi:flagellar basal body-associated protein FliL
MSWNPFSQNSNKLYNTQYTPGGYEKAGLRKILIIVVGVLVGVGIIVLAIYFSLPQSGQSKNTKSATSAARKETPNAKVSNVKVAGGFALATVSDPTAEGQTNAGNITIFKVNKD